MRLLSDAIGQVVEYESVVKYYMAPPTVLNNQLSHSAENTGSGESGNRTKKKEKLDCSLLLEVSNFYIITNQMDSNGSSEAG
jgi:hypothetical protein